MESRSVKSGTARIFGIFLFVAGILVASVVATYFIGLTVIEGNQTVARERGILRDLTDFTSTLKDSETSQRDYLLTGDERYLGSYRESLANIETAKGVLRQRVSAGDLPAPAIETVIASSSAKVAELEQTIQIRRDGDLAAALATVRVGEGKAIMDGIRAEVSRLATEEERKLQQARQRSDTAITARTIAFVATIALNLAFLAWAYRRIVREIGGREAETRKADRQKELLATTLTSIGDGVIATDAAGRVTFLNTEAERLTGWKSAEAASQPLQDVFRIINEATRRPVENPVEKVLRTGNVVGLANHTVLVAKHGAETLIDDSAAPIRHSGRSLSGVVLVFRDVTEQRQAQEAKARLAAIVEHSGDVIVMKNLDGRIQTWNASAERLFGYTSTEIVGKPVTILIPPERASEEEHVLDRIRQGQSVERLETIRVAKDGRRIPVALSVSPVRNSYGELIGASKVLHDITDLVAAREALVREKEVLATTLASIGDAVIATNEQGRITFLNAEAERLTKWPSAEAAGRPLLEVFRIVNETTRAPVENPVEKVLRLGGVVGLANHTVLIARDGTEIPIDDSAAP